MTRPTSAAPATAGAATVVARIPAERDRAVGSLTADEVRAGVARFLAPQRVAQLARAARRRAGTPAMSAVLAELRQEWHGCAGAGVICTGTPRGLHIEIADRGALVPWRLVAQIVADGTTPERLAALDTALERQDRRAGASAADAIVLAGPAALQLDLLDALTALDAAEEPVDGTRLDEPRNSAPDRATRDGPRPHRQPHPPSGAGSPPPLPRSSAQATSRSGSYQAPPCLRPPLPTVQGRLTASRATGPRAGP